MSKNYRKLALLFYHGFSAHRTCDLLTAKFYYYSYLKAERRNPDLWYLAGICHLEMKEWSEAYYALRRAVRLDSRSSVYWAGLALYYALVQKSHLAFYCCKYVENRGDLLKRLSLLIGLTNYHRDYDQQQILIYH